ncbi:MAG: tagatose-bisphosphate aldolase [Rhizobiales bacterium 32-66-8]|nr:MAG: tagatose-bisphosphate aldolase [Rhizobiales bacterium 32-66-8]
MNSIGKMRGLARLADADGHFRMVALDQRPPMFDAIAQARKIAKNEVTFADVCAAKRLLVEELSGHCSSMLMDPNFAVPAAIDALPPRTGLIVTLEEHRVEETQGGRKSRVIPNWSVEKIGAMGGDAVKVLAWYRPDADDDVIAHQKRFVREIGEDCRRSGLPFIFELLVFPFLGSAGHTADYVESPTKLPQLVIDSVREFAKPEYNVDLMKLESPLAAAALPARDGSAPSLAAQMDFDAVGKICRDAGVPWVMLSGGASRENFERVLEYAYAAGASGFLAGRTIWLDAVRSHFPDSDKVRNALRGDGIEILERLNRLTKNQASPWKPEYRGLDLVKAEGDFCRAG